MAQFHYAVIIRNEANKIKGKRVFSLTTDERLTTSAIRRFRDRLHPSLFAVILPFKDVQALAEIVSLTNEEISS